MLSLTRLVVMALATLSTAAAAPAQPEARSGPNSGIYLCTEPGFSGHCVHLIEPYGQCTSLDGDLAGKVSSVGPDWGNWCTMYKNYGCTGDELQEYCPGNNDLTGEWVGAIHSYNCAAL